MTKQRSQHNYVHHQIQRSVYPLVMELECVKYKEKVDSAGAYCRWPGDYCKDRTSCLIHFMGKENERADKGHQAVPAPENTMKRNRATGNDRA